MNYWKIKKCRVKTWFYTSVDGDNSECELADDCKKRKRRGLNDWRRMAYITRQKSTFHQKIEFQHF